jgi:hypothetical protein
MLFQNIYYMYHAIIVLKKGNFLKEKNIHENIFNLHVYKKILVKKKDIILKR